MRLALDILTLLINKPLWGRAGPQGPGLGSALLETNGGFYFISSLWLVTDNGFSRAFGGHDGIREHPFLNILSFHL